MEAPSEGGGAAMIEDDTIFDGGGHVKRGTVAALGVLLVMGVGAAPATAMHTEGDTTLYESGAHSYHIEGYLSTEPSAHFDANVTLDPRTGAAQDGLERCVSEGDCNPVDWCDQHPDCHLVRESADAYADGLLGLSPVSPPQAVDDCLDTAGCDPMEVCRNMTNCTAPEKVVHAANETGNATPETQYSADLEAEADLGSPVAPNASADVDTNGTEANVAADGGVDGGIVSDLQQGAVDAVIQAVNGTSVFSNVSIEGSLDTALLEANITAVTTLDLVVAVADQVVEDALAAVPGVR